MSDDKPYTDLRVEVGDDPSEEIAQIANTMIRAMMGELPEGHNVVCIVEGEDRQVCASTYGDDLEQVKKLLVRSLIVLMDEDIRTAIGGMIDQMNRGEREN